jgi:acetyl esterase
VHGYLRARTTVKRAADSFKRIIEALSVLSRKEWPY